MPIPPLPQNVTLAAVAAATLAVSASPPPVAAQEAGDAAAAETEPAPPAEVAPEVIDGLFVDFETAAAFSDAIQFAEQAGVDPQLVFEAKVRHYIYRSFDEAAARKLLREFDQRVESFTAEKSRLFESKDDLAAVRHVTLALIAFYEKDASSLKEHAAEAIWLNPDTAPMIASVIRSFRQRNED